MKIWFVAMFLLLMAISVKAQCECSDQLTRMQMQGQVDTENLIAMIKAGDNKTMTAIGQAQIDTKAGMDADYAQHDKNMVMLMDAVIDKITMRIVIALFATSGWFLSLSMLLIYTRS
jgi:hypothetical protein